MNKDAHVSIDTDQTVMQLYPHNKKPMHYFMALLTYTIFIYEKTFQVKVHLNLYCFSKA